MCLLVAIVQENKEMDIYLTELSTFNNRYPQILQAEVSYLYIYIQILSSQKVIKQQVTLKV